MDVASVTRTQDSAADAQARQSVLSLADFEQFLNLFVAQLRYQDPLSPLGGEEFLAQTAQFSTVEQLVNLNRKADEAAGANGLNTRATAAAMIGRVVTARTVDAQGAEVETTGRVVRVDFGPRGEPTLGLEDGTAVAFSDLVAVAET